MKQLALFIGILLAILSLLFYKSFYPLQIGFSNDGPLGTLVADQTNPTDTFDSLWADLNWLGLEAPAQGPTVSFGFRYLVSSRELIKVYTLFALLYITAVLFSPYCIRMTVRKLTGVLCFIYAFGMILAMVFASKDFLFTLLPISGVVFIFALLIVGITEPNERDYSNP